MIKQGITQYSTNIKRNWEKDNRSKSSTIYLFEVSEGEVLDVESKGNVWRENDVEFFRTEPRHESLIEKLITKQNKWNCRILRIKNNILYKEQIFASMFLSTIIITLCHQLCQSPRPARTSSTLLRAPSYLHLPTSHPVGWMFLEHNRLWLRISNRASTFSVTVADYTKP